MDLEKRKQLALRTFRGTYPSVTSGELQSFVLGMQTMENIYKEIEQKELENECHLNALEILQ